MDPLPATFSTGLSPSWPGSQAYSAEIPMPGTHTASHRGKQRQPFRRSHMESHAPGAGFFTSWWGFAASRLLSPPERGANYHPAVGEAGGDALAHHLFEVHRAAVLPQLHVGLEVPVDSPRYVGIEAAPRCAPAPGDARSTRRRGRCARAHPPRASKAGVHPASRASLGIATALRARNARSALARRSGGHSPESGSPCPRRCGTPSRVAK